MDTDFFKQYIQLRNEIDNRAQELTQMHSNYMRCKEGCSSCCERISVFPLEFYFIQNQLQAINFEYPVRKFNRIRKSCVFLKNKRCLIYSHRPIICRTQGLPLMYESLNGKGYEVSYCSLNFKRWNMAGFLDANTMFMPAFNSRLFLLNQQFIKTLTFGSYTHKSRIPLRNLSSEFKNKKFI